MEPSSALPYYGEGELVVSLGDEGDCVAVPELEGERASGVCATGACCVDGREHHGSVHYACGRGGRHCPRGSCVLVAVLVLNVVAGQSGRSGACVSQV